MPNARVSRPVLIVLVLLAVLAAGAAWWLFRPELLVVDERVSELPPASASGTAPAVLATGTFRSYAHETVGTATMLEHEGRRVLRLADFRTSNGPDVRVTLVAAAGRQPAAVSPAVISTREPGEMAGAEELVDFAAVHGLELIMSTEVRRHVYAGPATRSA